MGENYTIHLKNFPLPDKRLMAWLEANGLDPRTTPYDATVEVAGGFFTTQQFQFGSDGKLLLNADSVAVRETVAVPLVSRPEEHGIQRSAPTKHYVDLRFHFEERQEFPDEEPRMELAKVTRNAQHYMPDEVLEGWGEAFAQSDYWQIFFANEVPGVLTDGEPAVVKGF